MPEQDEIRKRITFDKDTYKRLSELSQDTGISEGRLIAVALDAIDLLGSNVIADEIMKAAKTRAARFQPKGK